MSRKNKAGDTPDFTRLVREKWKKYCNYIIISLWEKKCFSIEEEKWFSPYEITKNLQLGDYITLRKYCRKLFLQGILKRRGASKKIEYTLDWKGLIGCVYAKLCILRDSEFDNRKFEKNIDPIVEMIEGKFTRYCFSNINFTRTSDILRMAGLKKWTDKKSEEKLKQLTEKGQTRLEDNSIYFSPGYGKKNQYLRLSERPSHFLLCIHDLLYKISEMITELDSNKILRIKMPELEGAEAYQELMYRP